MLRRPSTFILAGLVAWLLAVLSLLPVLPPAAAADATPKYFSIGTAGSAGVYFVAGNAICRMVSVEAGEGRDDARGHGLRCSAPSTAGSIYNLEKLREGNLDFAIVQSDWQYHAANGTDLFEGRPIDGLRVVFSIHAEPFQILARGDAGISSWSDLAGRAVNIGNPESGQQATFQALLSTYGVGREYFGRVSELDSTKQAGALCRGEIDAFAFIVGVPNASVAEAADGCDAVFVPLADREVQIMVEENPFFDFLSIPAGSYATVGADVPTFGVTATLVTRVDVPDDVVYELVRAVFENFDDFRREHPAFRALTRKEMVTRGISARFHPGALRYYTENGFF